MISAFDNPGQPPMMSPESQSPPLYRVAGANMNQGMKDPKAQIALAMLAQQMARMGGGGAVPMQNSGMAPKFDLYGNPIQ